MAYAECCLEHDIQQKQEYGKSRILVGYEGVNDMGGLVCVALVAFLESRLMQCTVDDGVFGIYDGGLGVILHFLLDAIGLLVGYVEYVLDIR